jgi:hypothetical protein
MHIRLVQLDAHGFACILYFTIFALHVSGAIYTHHQERKLQSTAVGTCDCYGEKLDNPLEQVLAGTPLYFQHGRVRPC